MNLGRSIPIIVLLAFDYEEHGGQCEATRLGADRIESSILERLCENIITPQNIKILYDRWQAQSGSNKVKIEEQVANLERELSSISQKIKNLVQANENGQVIQSLIDQWKELDTVKNNIQRKIEQKQSSLATLDRAIPSDDQINEWVMNERAFDGRQY